MKKLKLFKILWQLVEIIIIFMKVQSRTEKYQKTPKTEATMTKKAKVSFIFFRPTVLHDHAASRLVNNKKGHIYCKWDFEGCN